jgi:SAM-dependent methyltransferase
VSREMRSGAKRFVVPVLWATTARAGVSGSLPPPQHAFGRRVDVLLSSLGMTPAFCILCRRFGRHLVRGPNLREEVACSSCGCSTRQRQVTLALVAAMLRRSGPLRIWSAECTGVAHDLLRAHFAGSVHEYFGTGYFGQQHVPGELVGGIRHEDLQHCSFADDSIDFVLTSDVLEHVPDPYRAHREIHRVLRPGGSHIFTVPFHEGQAASDQTRARLREDGSIEHLVAPLFHHDPLSPSGALVFTIFAAEMLGKLGKLGFLVESYRLWNPVLGLLGDNGLMFVARKPSPLADKRWKSAQPRRSA